MTTALSLHKTRFSLVTHGLCVLLFYIPEILTFCMDSEHSSERHC